MYRRIWIKDFFVRLTLLMVILSVLILYFYIIGNAQGFTDRTLSILMFIASLVFSFTALTAIFTIVVCVLMVPFQKTLNLPKILLFVLAFLLSLLLSMAIAILQVFMDGYSGY